jgi:uncharacterized protein YeaO (DUF488 family)
MAARSTQHTKASGGQRVRTKRVSEPKETGDGIRVLVMRLWPRGTKQSVADLWYKNLGTPVELIRQWKAGGITWPTLVGAYRKHLRTPEARADLHELVELARRGRVTLLCSCPDEARCHRGILRGVLLGAPGRV